jgi:hypothetical protein
MKKFGADAVFIIYDSEGCGAEAYTFKGLQGISVSGETA